MHCLTFLSSESSVEERRGRKTLRCHGQDGGIRWKLRALEEMAYRPYTAIRLSATTAIYFTQETQSSLARGNREKIRVRRELSLIRLAENRVEFARQA